MHDQCCMLLVSYPYDPRRLEKPENQRLEHLHAKRGNNLACVGPRMRSQVAARVWGHLVSLHNSSFNRQKLKPIVALHSWTSKLQVDTLIARMSSSRRRASKRLAVGQDPEQEPITFNESKFLSLDHFKRYKQIEGQALLSKRRVNLSKTNLPRVTA